MARNRNGAEFTVEFFRKAGVRHFFGIPGHGNISVFDAVKESESIRLIPPKHEQWGGHMADGYFRANRRVPALVSTSVGPGATNLATALATAYVDSSTFIAITGDVQTYLFGMGIFQEIDRKNWVDYVNGIGHFAKRTWQITNTAQLPRVLPNAFKQAVSGRPGPVVLDLPMDIQVEKVAGAVPDANRYLPAGRVYPDRSEVIRAAKLLLMAERPLILIGGGVTMSGATEQLTSVAEFIGAPVVASFRGDAKGGFSSEHELWGFHPGNVGSSVSNKLTREADVLLAIGTTFSDETTSSYRDGTTFSIPPTKVIQVDIDPAEIAKNYPVEVGIVSDARAALEVLADVLSQLSQKRDYRKSAWFSRLKELKEEWNGELKKLWAGAPMGIPSVVKMMGDVLPKESVISVSAGLPQEILSQQWMSTLPGTYLSSGGYSTMGFALPAAMGAKLAKPGSTVVAVEGDGSFLMNNVELSTAVECRIPVVVVILNNYGWVSIRDLQIRGLKRRTFGTEFKKLADFEKVVTAYGADYRRAEDPSSFRRALREAVKSRSVSVVDTIVDRRFPKSGTSSYGYWDIPTPYRD
ncbi:MAG: thiamine pyrophosphate-binding protein [Nitrososphaerota archaeon]|nr:thiamine pyrophosphate-binding protein [Nitrososphaerota archaeon]